jgi:hypothetical protein
MDSRWNPWTRFHGFHMDSRWNDSMESTWNGPWIPGMVHGFQSMDSIEDLVNFYYEVPIPYGIHVNSMESTHSIWNPYGTYRGL